MASWTVQVDRDRCMGSGVCLVYAPDTFSHDDEVKAVVDARSHEPLDTIRTAVEACPMQALQLHIDDE